MTSFHETIENLHAQYPTIPVPVRNIARDYNITIEESLEMGENAGSIAQINNNKYIIQLNIFNDLYRQNFTIAHELAHFFLHKNKIPIEY